MPETMTTTFLTSVHLRLSTLQITLFSLNVHIIYPEQLLPLAYYTSYPIVKIAKFILLVPILNMLKHNAEHTHGVKATVHSRAPNQRITMINELLRKLVMADCKV